MAITDTRKTVTLSVPAVVHRTLGDLAAKANTTVTGYATTLLMAAYTARVKPPTGDRDLDAQVARVVVLWGDGRDTAAIANAVGLSEATVVKVLEAWRRERAGGAS